MFIEPAERRVRYALVQDEWQFAPDWNLTSGLRVDDYSDFGRTTNPRLALVYNARHDLTAKLLYGRAFRAPSFAELFTQNNPVITGNPDLGPETIRTLELAFDYRPQPELRGGASIFAYRLEDLIRFVPQGGSTPAAARNTEGVDGRGLEIDARWTPLRALELSGSIALQDARLADSDQRIANAPGRQVTLGSHWGFAPDWHASLRVNHVADRRRSPGDPRPAPDDLTQTSLSLTRSSPGDRWSVELLATNLLDAEGVYPSPFDPNAPEGAFIPNDYPIPGRTLYITARANF